MTLAQELFELEEKKKNFLEQSRKNLSQHFFCFITFSHSYGYSRNSNIEPIHSTLAFQILSFDKKSKHSFYLAEFETNIEFKKKDNEPLLFIYRHSASPTTKNIGKNGLFLVNNYEDLSDSQKADYLNKVHEEYEKMQDPDDVRAIPKLETRGLIDYLKLDNSDLTLNEFVNELKKKVKPLVETYLTSIVYERTKKKWYNDKEVPPSTYELSQEEINTLIKDIQKNLVSRVSASIKPVEVRKDSSYGTSNEWDVYHNNAVNHFIAHDNQVLEARKSSLESSTKKTQKKLKS